MLGLLFRTPGLGASRIKVIHAVMHPAGGPDPHVPGVLHLVEGSSLLETYGALEATVAGACWSGGGRTEGGNSPGNPGKGEGGRLDDCVRARDLPLQTQRSSPDLNATRLGLGDHYNNSAAKLATGP